MADLKNTQSVMNKLNRISPVTNFAFNTFFLILAIVCFSPILIIFLIVRAVKKRKAKKAAAKATPAE